MPDQETIRRAREDKRAGKSPSTQAGEFVREEIHHIREGKHGAASTKQAIAIGLSKARRAGVDLPASASASASTRHKADEDLSRNKRRHGTSRKRSQGVRGALKRKPHSAASRTALARQAKSSARRRGGESRSAAARKASRTKGASGRSAAARKAARTRSRRQA